MKMNTIKKSLTCNILVVFALSILVSAPGHEASAEVLTLKDGLRLATENSRLIRIAEQEESVASADTKIAKSNLLPEITTSFSESQLAYRPGAIFGALSVPTQEQNFFAYSLDVQQTLYDFKGNASRYHAKQAIVNTKKLDTERIRNLVAIDFALAYLDALQSEKMILVAEKEVERLTSHFERAKALFEEGVITKNDLLQAEVRISDAKQRLLTARNTRAMASARLNNLLARSLKSGVEVKDIEGAPPEILIEDREDAWKIAEANRPEIRIVDETLQSLGFEAEYRRAQYYPKFFLGGGYDYVDNRFQIHQGNWSVILGMHMSLYNGGKTAGELEKIKGRKLGLLEQRKKLIDDIQLQIEQSVLAFENAKERVSVTRDAVQQGEENWRINKVKYEEGAGTATDVLDAVTLLTVAETNYYQSLYDLRKAEAALLYAVGIDLTEVY
jgi:outer membrane protein TolC